MEVLNRIEAAIVKLEKLVMLVMAVTMLILLSLQVFFRYVITLSIPWTEELSVTVFVVMCFYGASLASYNDRHIGIKNLVDRLNERAYILFWIGKKMIITVFLIAVVIRYGVPVALDGLKHTHTILRIPHFYVLIQIPIFGLLTVFHAIMSVIRKDYRRELAAR